MQGDKKYSFGNQEFELRTDYLKWIPEGDPNWDNWCNKDMLRLSTEEPTELTIISPDKTKKVTLLMDHSLVKGAFPLSFLTEERAQNWYRFYKVALKEKPEEQFLIPLH